MNRHVRHPALRSLPRLAALAVLCLSTTAQGAARQNRPPVAFPTVVSDGITHVADPKLAGGRVDIGFHLEPIGASSDVAVDILRDDVLVTNLWTGNLVGGAAAVRLTWDGKDDLGDWLDTGAYTIRIAPLSGANPVTPLVTDLAIVRLGIVEIEAQDSAGDDEHQMVYFRKGASYAFYATPAFHEYRNVAKNDEVSDLDLDDGSPRPSVAVHTATDSPVLDGPNYEAERFNYPLAYVRGSTPRFEVVLGASATSASGGLLDAGYPVAGYDLRILGKLQDVPFATSAPVSPGIGVVLDLPPLPTDVTRVELPMEWSWQVARTGTNDWRDIPGSVRITQRVYTLWDEPEFRAGASGTQYAGPWVEVAEYWYQWSGFTGADMSTDTGLVENHVRGFFGQNSGIPAAIEGVLYDAYPLGGDGGQTHYYNFQTGRMSLSDLLNAHALSVYINCSDNMGATTTMLAMMGIDGMRPVRLGPMTLNAIWGIGAPDYTTNLWGGAFGHGFSYHHIVTRDNGLHVSDTCMQLDADGTPGSTPGTPGWNVDRLWAGTGGYDQLSSTNTVTKTLENLPGLD